MKFSLRTNFSRLNCPNLKNQLTSIEPYVWIMKTLSYMIFFRIKIEKKIHLYRALDM